MKKRTLRVYVGCYRDGSVARLTKSPHVPSLFWTKRDGIKSGWDGQLLPATLTLSKPSPRKKNSGRGK